MVTHKYIAPDLVEDWVRNLGKSHVGGSVIWKAVVTSFPVIETNLAWNIGDGRRLRVEEDPWVGCVGRHLLSSQTVAALRARGINFLSQLAEPVQERPWVQSWRTVNSLGLPEPDHMVMYRLLLELNRTHVLLRNKEDE